MSERLGELFQVILRLICYNRMRRPQFGREDYDMMTTLIKDILLLLVLLFLIACSLTTFLPEDPSLEAQTMRMDPVVEVNHASAEPMVPEHSTE